MFLGIPFWGWVVMVISIIGTGLMLYSLWTAKEMTEEEDKLDRFYDEMYRNRNHRRPRQDIEKPKEGAL